MLDAAEIPRFAPEMFARLVPGDPMKRKQLDAGLRQLTEEGAAQVFFTSATETVSPTPIVGAVGMLQFDVVAYRLKDEYGVDASFEQVNVATARWIRCSDASKRGASHGLMMKSRAPASSAAIGRPKRFSSVM